MIQTGNKLLKEEVIHLKENTDTLNTTSQSNEVLLDLVQTNNTLFEKEIAHLKDDTRTLLNRTQSTEKSLV